MDGEDRIGERLGALFLLGAVIFNPLIIDIFDLGAERSLLGIPVLYVYVFAAWGALIALLAAVVELSAPDEERRPPPLPEQPGRGGPDL